MTPIVLQHGLFGFGDFKVGTLRVSYFNGIDRALEERGHPLIISRVHPTGSIELRAGSVAPERALLVDDVLTTGATINACIRALHAAGTREVAALAYARTTAR